MPAPKEIPPPKREPEMPDSPHEAPRQPPVEEPRTPPQELPPRPAEEIPPPKG